MGTARCGTASRCDGARVRRVVEPPIDSSWIGQAFLIQRAIADPTASILTFRHPAIMASTMSLRDGSDFPGFCR